MLIRKLTACSFFSLLVVMLSASQSPLVFNEILFKQAAGNQEWIEIYNRSSETILMENYQIVDAADTRTRFSGSIIPGQYLVICRNKEQLLASYPFIDAANVIESTSWAILNNDRETVWLLDSANNVLDSLSYTAPSSYPHDVSLERVNPYDDNSEWKRSLHPGKSTPTFANSHLPLEYDLELMQASSARTGERIEHTLIVKNSGYRLIDEFELRCYAYFGNFSAELIYTGERATSGRQELTVVFLTDVPQSEYTTYEYRIVSAQDMDESNNLGVSFINNNALPAVVNEIMFRTDDNIRKWVEIHINKRYRHLSQMTLLTQRDAVTFAIGDADYLLITNSAADSLFLQERFNLTGVPIYTGLSNLLVAGEELTLQDPCGNIIESFFYQPHWSTQSNVSIERINPYLAASDDNWGHSIAVQGSTPGFQNSIYTPFIPPATTLEIAPNPFSPLRGEKTIISFEFPERLNRVTCRIFDLKGRIVNTLINQEIQAAAGTIIWDGYRDNGDRLLPGVYIVALEAAGLDTETIFRERTTVVIGR